MKSTYIERYEKNLIQNAKKEIALKMKSMGIATDIIFECTGFKL